MKRHLGWLHVAATAAIVAGSGLPHAVAQYGPYRPIPQQPAPKPVATQPPVAAAMQPAYMPYQPQGPQYRTAMAPYGQAAGYPQTAAVYPQTNQYPQYPGYPQVAQQPTEAMPAPSQPETLPPPATMNGAATNGTMMPNGHGMGAPAYGAGNMSGYPSTGCYGDASGYGYSSNGNHPDYGLSSYFDNPRHDTQWFGGVYLLWMERDNPANRRLTVGVEHDDVPGYPYYPPSTTTINHLHCPDLDHDYREGLEIRVGSTFTIGSSCDSGYGAGGYGYGCEPCPPCSSDVYAWEVAWWAIDDDAGFQQVVNGDPEGTFRLYGTVNYAGLGYDPGSGNRTVNQYYDYQMPVNDPATYEWPDGSADDVRVLAQRVRTNFRASNLELNFLRLPMVTCGAPCGGAGGSGDCGYGECAPACAPAPFSLTGLCGVRYFRVDDDFQFASEWDTDTGGGYTGQFDGWYNGDNELFHEIEVENHLVGFQLGANMNYAVTCKCNVFWDTHFGVYNNHINHYQRIYNPFNGGYAEFTEEARPARVRSDKDDIAFLGEMRLGGAYDFSCHWRGVLAYRAVAISGLALSTEQIRPEYSDWANTALIDSDGSIIIHGVQAGVECRY